MILQTEEIKMPGQRRHQEFNNFSTGPSDNDILEFEFSELIAETDKAWLIYFSDELDQAWMPKSQCSIHMNSREYYNSNKILKNIKDRSGSIDIPRWLAQRNGLIDE